MIYLDIETRSPTPIADGSYRYAERAEVILMQWARDGGEVRVAEVDRAEAIRFVQGTDEAIAAHGPFERILLGISPERYIDVIAWAHSHGLPGSLDKLCDIFRLTEDQAKIKEGGRLIQRFCKPNAEGGYCDKTTHPVEWERFKEYAGRDVIAMREITKRLPNWNYPGNRFENRVYCADQRINDRGMRIDIQLAANVVGAVRTRNAALDARVDEITEGAVNTANQRDALLEHVLDAFGVSLPDLTKSTVTRRLEDPDLPNGVKELLTLRLETATTTASKYKTLLRCANADGRLRGALVYSGAQRTHRWAGRMFQPHNLARPTWKYPDIAAWIDCMRTFGDAPDVKAGAREAARGCIVAPEGKILGVVDWKNVEGRVAAWGAGENWKVQAFRDYDEGSGPDLYLLAYAKAFGVPIERARRDVGKVMELALQYEGGVGAFFTFSTVYGVDLEAISSDAPVPAWALEEAEWLYANRGKYHMSDYGLSQRAWVTCDALKRLWRAAHPAIVEAWRKLKEGWICACAGGVYRSGHFKVDKRGAWLRVHMPNGTCLCYPGARYSPEDGCSFMGLSHYTKQWTRIRTHGGKLFENWVQKAARDVLARVVVEADSRGLPIVLTVHDEPVAELNDETELERLEALCLEAPTWATGLPLAVEGFTTTRYHKE